MSNQEKLDRNHRILTSIQAVLRVHEHLWRYADLLQVTIENTVVVLRGSLPNADLKHQLVPAIRRAGVLSQISNEVHVRSEAA